MVVKGDLQKVNEFVYEIPADYASYMRVPARLYTSRQLLALALRDRSLEQLVNTTSLPGIVGHALAMPDMHQGYGFSIGGVAATALPDGSISPGGVGYDINCGVRLLSSYIPVDAIRDHAGQLLSGIHGDVPSGLGRGGAISLSDHDLDQVMERGAAWVVEKLGYGSEQDLARTEEGGSMAGADPAQVSPRARERAGRQLGTLGSGNHFVELDRVAEIYDPEVAEAFGLHLDHVAVQIHSGSRALGHQICTDHVRHLQKAVRRYGIDLPDRELACVPFSSPEGQSYFGAMASAANFAWANRQAMAHLVRQVFERILARVVENRELPMVYDVAHNIAKIEWHEVDGVRRQLCVHRKGATRSFGPGSPDLPPEYANHGQPVLIPGSMGTASYVMIGTDTAMRSSWGSTCHGAGRVMSRKAAKRVVNGAELRDQLESQGIAVRAGRMSGLAEEAPIAYKDVHEVIRVVDGAGLSRKVARLEPIGVMKG
jgi:tRNA-splicing ligase RtcB (3'-phosphate/5'-hydroxy nucleic acid ligase)